MSAFTGLVNTYILLLIGSNGSDISSKATVAASIDLLVIKASGVKAHSLLSFLQQGCLHPLDLQDLGLDIYREFDERVGGIRNCIIKKITQLHMTTTVDDTDVTLRNGLHGGFVTQIATHHTVRMCNVWSNGVVKSG